MDATSVVAIPRVLALALALATAFATALVIKIFNGLSRSASSRTQMLATINVSRKSPTAARTTSGTSVYTQCLHWLLDDNVTWYPPANPPLGLPKSLSPK